MSPSEQFPKNWRVDCVGQAAVTNANRGLEFDLHV
jgi:hypothetical protein